MLPSSVPTTNTLSSSGLKSKQLPEALSKATSILLSFSIRA